MRRIIAALRVSPDGFIEGPNGEMDWVETWEDPFDLLGQVDTCILGRGMYRGYEQYWQSVLTNPSGNLPFKGRPVSKGEMEYAQFAVKTPHIVLSRTLQDVEWKNTRIVRDAEEIRRMKHQSGKDMYAIGGATLVSSLMNLGLVDELRLVVQPIVLGKGKTLFKDVQERRPLKLLDSRTLDSGMVRLSYSL